MIPDHPDEDSVKEVLNRLLAHPTVYKLIVPVLPTGDGFDDSYFHGVPVEFALSWEADPVKIDANDWNLIYSPLLVGYLDYGAGEPH